MWLAMGEEVVAIEAVVPAELFSTTSVSCDWRAGTLGKSSGLMKLCKSCITTVVMTLGEVMTRVDADAVSEVGLFRIGELVLNGVVGNVAVSETMARSSEDALSLVEEPWTIEQVATMLSDDDGEVPDISGEGKSISSDCALLPPKDHTSLFFCGPEYEICLLVVLKRPLECDFRPGIHNMRIPVVLLFFVGLEAIFSPQILT